MNDGTVELDHFFVITEPQAPQAGALVDAGFLEGSPNRHPDQGTACRRFFFANVMLEFIWLRDAIEARRGPAARTGLADRAERRGGGASPFGLCVRPKGSPAPPPPFPTWRYAPPYLPDDRPAYEISRRSLHVDEPFLFYMPRHDRPDLYPPGKSEPLDHPCGARELTHLILHCPTPDAPDLLALAGMPDFSVVPSASQRLELVFDDARQGQSLELSALHLSIRY